MIVFPPFGIFVLACFIIGVVATLFVAFKPEIDKELKKMKDWQELQNQKNLDATQPSPQIQQPLPNFSQDLTEIKNKHTGYRSTDEILSKVAQNAQQLVVASYGDSDKFKNIARIGLELKRAPYPTKEEYSQFLIREIAVMVSTVETYYSHYQTFHSKAKNACAEKSYWELIKVVRQEKMEQVTALVEGRFNQSYARFSDLDVKIEQLEFDYLYNLGSISVLSCMLVELFTDNSIVTELNGRSFDEIHQSLKNHHVFYLNLQIGNVSPKAA
ncbi:MAG: hypothetical protein H0V66_07440 [Bdellovibrionales bacterium]|nr:hypothetical protein [Bdellovibrionales bacterium]